MPPRGLKRVGKPAHLSACQEAHVSDADRRWSCAALPMPTPTSPARRESFPALYLLPYYDRGIRRILNQVWPGIVTSAPLSKTLNRLTWFIPSFRDMSSRISLFWGIVSCPSLGPKMTICFQTLCYFNSIAVILKVNLIHFPIRWGKKTEIT